MKLPRLLSLFTLVFSLLSVTEAVAQVKTDNTLGNENSVVVPIDQLNQRIDGGATRGANLFHSFLEFNVGAGRGVYFANPAGIENILSRITGNKPSRIFGTLGVLGDANLFLLNPNGIFFGENASLDINGSFLATTADGINLGNQGYFSASEPQTSNLLAVEPGALFFNQVANQPGEIRSQGNLTTGGNFTLWADNLDLKGQLQAGGDLTLQAQDKIKAQDNVANPFIAQAGNQLLVQGNEKVEILAFNHPDSGLFSGGDMTLRSANRVGGDTRYTSGGNFTIEQLDGSLGDLFSPKDPIVRAGGDVSFNSYTGASLHILAGGSVTIPGNIRITGTDTVDNSIQENVTLSKEIVVDLDGNTQPIVANIDGSIEPTVDIRAGTTAFGTAGITGNPGGFSAIPGTGGTGTSADITIGSIINEGGLVFLTNQYVPNTALPAGTIQVGDINTSDRMEAGGNIYIDSRGSIQLNSNLNSSARRDGNAGDIVLFADEEIAIANSRIASDSRNGFAGLIEVQAGNSVEITASTLTSESIGSDTSGDGGAIRITAKTGSIALENGTRLNTSARGNGFAGGIILNAGNEISLTNNSSIISNADNGFAGLINLQAANDINLGNSQIKAESSGTDSSGSGGEIRIASEAGSISLDEVQLNTRTTGDGFAGNISLNAGNEISLINNSQIISDANNGFAGLINLQATNDINFSTGEIKATSRGNDTAGSSGFGFIKLKSETGSIALDNGAQLNTSARGNGFAGDITLDAGNQITLANNSEIKSNANIGLGTIRLEANNDINVSNSDIKAESGGSDDFGVGGSINITAKTGSIAINEGAQLNTSARGNGFAGNIALNAGNQITLASNSEIRSNADNGVAGTINLQANNSVNITNGEIQAQSKGSDTLGGGSIEITAETGSIALNEGARLNTSATGNGFAGNIALNAGNQITLASDSEIRSNADNGVAGTINLQANNSVNITNGEVQAESQGSDTIGGGSIEITAETDSISLNDGAKLNTSATGDGFAGNIDLNAGNQITLASNSEIRSNADNGEAGKINLLANNDINVTNGEIQAQSKGSNNAGGGFGSINVTTENGSIALSDGARLNTSATGDGFAGDITLNAGNQITLTSDSEIRSNADNGVAGEIELQANNSVEVINSKLRAESEGADNFGVGGFIEITAKTSSISLDGATLSTTATGSGVAGFIRLDSGNQIITNNSKIQSNAANGLAGAIDLQADSSVFLTSTQITADSEPVSGGILINGEQGDGGDIGISSWSLVMTDSAISSNSRGDGDAGNITLNIIDNLHLDNSQVTADSTQAGGGDINITAYDSRLRNGSLISSSVANGDGGGGDINITSPLFLALEDSDILANANQGAGGNININSEAFLADLFGSGNAVAVGSNPGDFNQFRGNDRVDISASSQVAGLSGQVSFPDFSFLQYSLSQLSANFVNPEQAIAGSCLARRNTQQGSFTVTGTGGLPPTPNNTFSSQYRLRGVQPVGEGTVSHTPVQPTAAIPHWQLGDSVIEAQGLIATADGRIVLGNEPQLATMVSVEDVLCEQQPH
ncbi:MAG: filamentous hemagglutinin N-terminal domain-containing protein [Symploca sp. SIO3E6]|nr:filamentous hemagglutinin N-terminal domain-containing protein [Caldora sp. SIO3E6]